MRFRSFAWVGWSSLCVVVGCGGAGTSPDGGSDMHVGPCATSADCDDGRYCNGDEVCMPGSSAADARGCLPGSPPCEISMCDEAMDLCPAGCDDADADGHHSMACGGDDCDDSDPDVYPGHTEVCDTSNHDEDCDPNTYGFRDSDGDAAPDQACCNIDSATGETHCGSDCDDMRPDRHPGLAEACDGADNDCDGMVDEDVERMFWEDADGDGYGSSDPAAMTAMGCTRPDHFAETHDDCRDDLLAAHPGAVELCDPGMVDEDCDGTPNPAALCACTVPSMRMCALAGPCAAGVQTCVGGAWSPCSILPTAEVCDSVDNDCNGTIDDGLTVRCFADGDGDGYATSGAMEQSVCPGAGGSCPSMFTSRNPSTAPNADCNDTDNGSHPGAMDNTCDCIDQNCDGVADDAAPAGVKQNYYPDGDGDGFGDDFATPMLLCMCAAAGRTTDHTDCYDAAFIGRATAATVHPGATDFHATGYTEPCRTPSPPCIEHASFDYNCDGISEKETNNVPPVCTFLAGFGCVGGGASYTGTHNCGDSVNHVPCTTMIGTGACVVGRGRNAALQCR